MKEILVAIDGSKHSVKIVDSAVELAKNLPAKILLLYVTPEPRLPEGYERYAKAEGVDPSSYLESLAKQIIRDAEGRINAGKVQSEGLTIFGNPASVILETAKSRGVSMIVLGVQGLHGIGRMRALGSISRRVIENSDVPVVAVP